MRHSGKVVVITGGASGMGAAMVERFVEEGATVLATDINAELGAKVATAAGASFAEQDTSSAQGWQQLMRQVREQHGRLDVLINNAGIVTGKSIEEVDLETWHRVIDVNLTGVMLGCQQAIALMRDNPDEAVCSIINISSTSAVTALPGDVGYTAAKSGVRMLTKAVAVHCGQNDLPIRCNSIIPGAIDTGIIANAAERVPNIRDHLATLSPMKRMGNGMDIAGAASFLASPDASFVNGTELVVDGAMLSVHPGF